MKLPDIKKIHIGKKELIVLLAVLVFAVIAVIIVRNSDGAQSSKRHTANFKALGEALSVTCYGKAGKEAVKEAKKEIVRLDKQRSLDGDGSSITAGYVADVAVDIIKTRGASSALLSFGDNVIAVGKKYNGKLWRVGVKNHRESGSNLIGVLDIQDSCSFTFSRKSTEEQENNKNELLSITVVSPYGAVAEALSASLYKMGIDEAVAYWKENSSSHGAEFEMIMVTELFVYATEGLKGSFSSDEAIEWIKK